MSKLFPPSRCTGSLPADLEKPNLIGEEKLDGSRYCLYLKCDPYERREGNALLSRRVSVKDRMHVDRTDNVPHFTHIDYEGLDGTVLDGEVMSSDFLKTNSIMNSGPALAVAKQMEKGKLNYHVFDCMAFRGEDIRGLPLQKRRLVLEEVIRRMDNENVRLIPQFTSNLTDHFTRIVEGGGEGIIVKDLNAGYGNLWAKWKRRADVSCIITGFKTGNGKYSESIGSIAVSVYKGDELIEIGFASGFNDELRKDIAENSEKYLGRVVDIHAQEFQKTTEPRLRHPAFSKLRDDINPKDCTLEKAIDDLKRRRNYGISAHRSKR